MHLWWSAGDLPNTSDMLPLCTGHVESAARLSGGGRIGNFLFAPSVTRDAVTQEFALGESLRGPGGGGSEKTHPFGSLIKGHTGDTGLGKTRVREHPQHFSASARSSLAEV